jgi:type I restriction enzyme S subunit
MAERRSELQDLYRTKLEAISALRQSILQKAFSGELTSPPSQAIKEAAE